MKRASRPLVLASPLVLSLVASALVALLLGCSGDAAPEPTAQPAPTALPATAAPIVREAAAGPVTISVTEASKARYLVNERLQRLTLPNDAIGETSDVRGSIVFDSDGSVDADSSHLLVGLSGLTSDESRRDRWVRTELFNTNQFPDAKLALTAVESLPWPLPETGVASFRLIGDLTIKEVTSSTVWEVTGQFDGASVTGQAKTVVTFEQFELPKPTFAFILSVENEIRLEIDIDASIN